MAPYWSPKLKVPETPLIESRHLSINAKNYESLRTNEVVGVVVKELIAWQRDSSAVLGDDGGTLWSTLYEASTIDRVDWHVCRLQYEPTATRILLVQQWRLYTDWPCRCLRCISINIWSFCYISAVSFVSEMTYYVSSGTLNPTHSLCSELNQSINQSVNFLSGLSSDATTMAIMGVTVKKCHRIMSGNDCWNRVCLSCCWKADNELADVTLSGSLFQNRAAATGNARPPTVDSLNGGICRRFDPAERSARRSELYRFIVLLYVLGKVFVHDDSSLIY